jgi:hypothetical protein
MRLAQLQSELNGMDLEVKEGRQISQVNRQKLLAAHQLLKELLSCDDSDNDTDDEDATMGTDGVTAPSTDPRRAAGNTLVGIGSPTADSRGKSFARLQRTIEKAGRALVLAEGKAWDIEHKRTINEMSPGERQAALKSSRFDNPVDTALLLQYRMRERARAARNGAEQVNAAKAFRRFSGL